jgi:O-antigen/teichoic acid export membrane protein
VTATPPPAEAERLDIAGAIASGIKWNALSQFLGEVTRVVLALILARLLTPADYGVAGMATVCVSFASLFTDPALGTALIQRRQIDEDDRSTVFWTTVAVGAAVAIAGVLLSGYVADLFGQHEVKSLFMVLCAGLFISSLSVTQLALLTRSLAYRSLEIRGIIASVFGAAAAISVAFAGFGPWAIITNWLVVTTVSALLVWLLSPWRPRFVFSRASLRNLGSFGVKVFAARILSWGNSNMDNVLVGRYLGAAPLGAYALAYNVMYVPITRISSPLTRILSAAYARMQHEPERLHSAWLRGRSILSALLSPAFAIVIVIAPDLVPVAFGAKWHNAVTPLQLLTAAGFARTLVATNWSLLTALGRPGTVLRIQVIAGVVVIGSFVAGLPFGIVGVAGFYAIARTLLAFVDTGMTTRAAGYPFLRSLRSGAEPLPLALAAGAVGLGLRLLLVHEHVPAAARLFVVSGAIVGAYLSLLYLVSPRMLAEAIAMLRRRAPQE